MEVLLQGDPEIWHAAFKKYGSSLLAYLKLRTGSREEAEDLLQETFVKAISARETIVDYSKLKSFLFTTAHRTFLNRIRKKKNPTSTLWAPSKGMEDQVADPSASPEAQVHFHSFEQKLNRVLQQMKPKYQTAFTLAVLQQNSYAAISRMTGWSLASVKINVYRARKQVMSELGEFFR